MDKLLALVQRSRIVPIVLAGGVGFAIQLGVFEVLGIWWAVVSPAVATVIGGEAGIVANFVINDRISFKHHAGKLPLWHRMAQHQAVVLVAVGIQWALVYTAQLYTTNVLYLHLALFAGIAISLVWNYSWYHLFVWKKKKNN